MNLPLLFHQGLFEVLAVATNSSSSVPPHWNLLNSYYEKMSYEMLIDIMFSTVILVRSHGKLSWELAREIPNNAVSRSIFMRLSSLARKNRIFGTSSVTTSLILLAGVGRLLAAKMYLCCCLAHQSIVFFLAITSFTFRTALFQCVFFARNAATVSSRLDEVRHTIHFLWVRRSSSPRDRLGQ
jgi:hypothetical protein